MVTEVETKLKAVIRTAQAMQDTDNQLDTSELKGRADLEALKQEWREVQTVLDTATDLSSAKEALKLKEGIEQDIRLQETVNEAKRKQSSVVLENQFEEFAQAYNELKQAYSTLDSEIAQTMSVSTVTEDAKLMGDIGWQATNTLSLVTTLLIKHEIVTRSNELYKGFHLGQMGLNTYGKYREVASSLEHFVRTLGE